MKAVRVYSIVVASVCGIASVLYFVIIPWRSVDAYSHAVSEGAQMLGPDFWAIEQTTEWAVFSDPDLSLDERRREVGIIIQMIDATEGKIVQYKDQTSMYETARYTRVMPVYADAEHTRQSIEYMAAQSREVLEKYRVLILFVDSATRTQQVLQRHMDEINAIRDFNELAGLHAPVYDRARLVREAQTALEAAAAPQELESVKIALTDRCRQLADGLEALAYGLETAVDANIYGATAEIERVTYDYDHSDRLRLYEAVRDSPTLKSVTELTDKLYVLEMAGSRN